MLKFFLNYEINKFHVSRQVFKIPPQEDKYTHTQFDTILSLYCQFSQNFFLKIITDNHQLTHERKISMV